VSIGELKRLYLQAFVRLKFQGNTAWFNKDCVAAPPPFIHLALPHRLTFIALFSLPSRHTNPYFVGQIKQ
jgi:hypothetical protein